MTTDGGDPLIETIVELVHSLGEAQRLELEVIQQLSAALGALSASHGEMGEHLGALRWRIGVLERGDASASVDGGPGLPEPGTHGEPGLRAQAEQAQRHADALLRRTAALVERADGLMDASHRVLAAGGRTQTARREAGESSPRP